MSVDLSHIQEVKRTADCLFDSAAIEDALCKLAREISTALSDTNPLIISLMNGGLITTGRLLTKLDFNLQVDFIHASRYHDQTSGAATLEWKVEPHHSLQDRHVLLVDDILDEGMTLHEIINFCQHNGATKVYSAVLADKQHDRRRPEGFKADFTGLTVEDRYVFGCGMDYKGYLRNADGIYAVAEKFLRD